MWPSLVLPRALRLGRNRAHKAGRPAKIAMQKALAQSCPTPCWLLLRVPKHGVKGHVFEASHLRRH